MAFAQPRRWARLTVDLATWLLPPGEERDRFRHELTAELWTMSPREQLAASVSIVRCAPELRRAVVESGVLPHPHTIWWCRLHGRHHWHRRVADDGGRYRHCEVCGLDDDGTVNQMYAGWQGANIPSTTGRP